MTSDVTEESPHGSCSVLDPRIQVTLDFMSTNLQENLSLSNLSALVGLSPAHFGRLFKSQTGLSPAKRLKGLRMERAKHLLSTSLLSVKQIMGMVGYSDKSDFTRDFKAAFGLTPSDYRKTFLDLILLKDYVVRQRRKID